MSLYARIALALHIFADYCAIRGVVDPRVGAFLDHMWRYIVLEPGEPFKAWQASEPELIFSGLGDELPPDFEAMLESRGVPVSEFHKALCCTTEVLYWNLYAAADEVETRRYLRELADLAASVGVAFPDIRPFLGSRWADGLGFVDHPSLAEWLAWRGRTSV